MNIKFNDKDYELKENYSILDIKKGIIFQYRYEKFVNNWLKDLEYNPVNEIFSKEFINLPIEEVKDKAKDIAIKKFNDKTKEINKVFFGSNPDETDGFGNANELCKLALSNFTDNVFNNEVQEAQYFSFLDEVLDFFLKKIRK